MRLRAIAVLLALFVICHPGHAQVPRLLTYQGIITDSLGAPAVDGPHPAVFRLYAAASGGSALWTEAQSVTTRGGVFTTQLGTVTPFPSSLGWDTPYWLGLAVDGSGELTPRIRLSSVPYSLGAVRADSAMTVRNGSITAAKLAPNSVTSSALQNGSVQMSALAQGGAASGEVLKWNGSSWAPGTDNVGTGSTFWTSGSGNSIQNTNAGPVFVGARDTTYGGKLVALQNQSSSGPAVVGRATVSGASGVLGVGSDGAGVYGFSSSGLGVSGASTSGIGGRFSSASGPAALVSLGRLGINTESPQSLLHIQGDNEVLRLQGTNPFLQLYNASGGATGYLWQKNTNDVELGISNLNPSGRILFATQSTERMSISPSGNVGIGTSNPSAKLHVQGSNEVVRLQGSNPFLQLYNSLETPVAYFWQKGLRDAELGISSLNPNGRLFIANNGTPRMVIEANGSVGVGTSAPTATLQVKGDFAVEQIDNGNAWSLYLTGLDGYAYWRLNGSNKAFISPLNGSWNTFSSPGLEAGAVPYPGVLERVRDLPISLFGSGPEAGQNRSPGLLLKDAEEHLPELVNTPGDEKKSTGKGISYGLSGLVALRAIQEQQAIIDGLVRRIEELEKKMGGQ